MSRLVGPIVRSLRRAASSVQRLAARCVPSLVAGMAALPVLNPDLADEQGLVAIGGDLAPDRLLDAYRQGIFPWYDEGDPVCWWSPDPRAIFELDGLRVSRRLLRTIRSGRFTCTVNRAFGGVIRGCADRPDRGPGSPPT